MSALILFQDAYERAQSFLDENVRPSHRMEIVVCSCEEYPGAWVFGYNTRRFLAGGDLMSLLVGSGPVVVPKNGDVVFLSASTSPISEQLAQTSQPEPSVQSPPSS
ncbi:YrhB domain-containing protein [Promicromonospora sukumoe]|uniref:YrhB domain-containing protein n=1 Tax=Promicromonospora sukumoe TaxID=88382 RepID=UPI0003610925|nr:YrhB domain-containing protein [Promicromonospora sukumoe]